MPTPARESKSTCNYAQSVGRCSQACRLELKRLSQILGGSCSFVATPVSIRPFLNARCRREASPIFRAISSPCREAANYVPLTPSFANA